jgi:hypothetical protein
MKISMSTKASHNFKQSSLQRIGDYSYNTTDTLGQGSFSTVYLGRSLVSG